MNQLFSQDKLNIINVGLKGFGPDAMSQGAVVKQVEWKPVAGGRKDIIEALDKVEPLAEKIKEANETVISRMKAAKPVLVGMDLALNVVPEMTEHTILHAGPPIAWENMCGPMRGAVIGAVLFEGLAADDEEAVKLIESGAIKFDPCHEHKAVGPMADVAKRIAVMDRTSPDVVKEVEKVLESKLASLVNQDYTIIGGVDAVVDILNTVDRGTEKHIMETLEIEEPELADEIRKKMFVFEDILLLDDRAIQRVLRDVDNNDLALALKGGNEQVQNAIFNNLSKRLAVMIKEDMEFMGPVRMKDVEEAQQKIVNIIRKLEDSGEIVISRGGGDEIIV